MHRTDAEDLDRSAHPRRRRTEGGVLWNPRLPCVSAPQAYFQTASPDETFRIATTAMESWTVANFPMPAQPDGCIWADVDDRAMGLRIWVEAGEITYAFEHRGVAVEEHLAVVVTTVESLSPTADGSVLGYQARTPFGRVGTHDPSVVTPSRRSGIEPLRARRTLGDGRGRTVFIRSAKVDVEGAPRSRRQDSRHQVLY